LYYRNVSRNISLLASPLMMRTEMVVDTFICLQPPDTTDSQKYSVTFKASDYAPLNDAQNFSSDWGMTKCGVHNGSIPSPLPFITQTHGLPPRTHPL